MGFGTVNIKTKMCPCSLCQQRKEKMEKLLKDFLENYNKIK